MAAGAWGPGAGLYAPLGPGPLPLGGRAAGPALAGAGRPGGPAGPLSEQGPSRRALARRARPARAIALACAPLLLDIRTLFHHLH